MTSLWLKNDLDRELPPDNEHLINPADIPTVQPKFVKIVDQWASRSSGGNGDSNMALSKPGRDSTGGLEKSSRKKYNVSSTSNIHLEDSTVSKPNLKAMLKCLVWGLAAIFNPGHSTTDCISWFSRQI